MKKKQLFLIIMMIILIIPNTIFAFASELIPEPKPWVPEDIATMASTILGVIQWAGYAIAVGMLLYIGIKYMMSAANEKANLKQVLINYFIGALIVAGVTTIFTGIVEFFTGEQVSYDGPKLSYEEYVAEYGKEGMDSSELAEAYKEYSQKYDEVNGADSTDNGSDDDKDKGACNKNHDELAESEMDVTYDSETEEGKTVITYYCKDCGEVIRKEEESAETVIPTEPTPESTTKPTNPSLGEIKNIIKDEEITSETKKEEQPKTIEEAILKYLEENGVKCTVPYKHNIIAEVPGLTYRCTICNQLVQIRP